MFVFVASCRVLPERLTEFLALTLDGARGALRDEPGCQRFDVVQATADESRIWFYEVYRDRAAFAAHRASPHFLHWQATVKDWLSAPLRSTACSPLFLTEEAASVSAAPVG
jgi:autoinducer 2-degrading protein